MGYASLATTANCPWEFIFTLPKPTVTNGYYTSLIGGYTMTVEGSGFDSYS